MKAQISMEKPTIITTEQPAKAADGDCKKKSNVKTIVLSVAAVCVVITVVAGFLFAFKFHAESTNEIVKRTIEAQGLKETIEENKAENTKLYTIQNQGETQQVLYDFNRKLKLVKADNRCIVYAINSTQKDEEEMTSSESLMYNFDSQPVHDKSFLSKTGQKLCNDEHVYWAFPTCGDDANFTHSTVDGDDKGVEKRDTHQRLACYNCCITCGLTTRIPTLARRYCIRSSSYYLLLVRVCGTTYCRCSFYAVRP